MSEVTTREEMFQQILIERFTGEETCRELRENCVKGGLFEDDAGLVRAIEAYQDRVIRSLARRKDYVDKDGLPLQLYSVPRVHPTTGKKTQMYLDLKLGTFDDHTYLVKDRLERAEYFTGEARMIHQSGCAKFGRKFQRQFPQLDD